jgi:hypothetical protein
MRMLSGRRRPQQEIMKAVERQQKQRNVGHQPPYLNGGWKLRTKTELEGRKEMAKTRNKSHVLDITGDTLNSK